MELHSRVMFAALLRHCDRYIRQLLPEGGAAYPHLAAFCRNGEVCAVLRPKDPGEALLYDGALQFTDRLLKDYPAAKKGTARASIFSKLHGQKKTEPLVPAAVGFCPPEVLPDGKADPAAALQLLDRFAEQVLALGTEERNFALLLRYAEEYLTYLPGSETAPDISLYDLCHLSAAYASCACLWAMEQPEDRVRRLADEKLLQEQTFVLASFDISGIQAFLYDITSKGALKNLRARSLYLDLLAENTAEELLARCGLSRASLLYAGGGHAYFLLPNTASARGAFSEGVRQINKGILNTFETAIYIGAGLQECSGAALESRGKNSEEYSGIFRSISRQISGSKLQRYDAETIRFLNRRHDETDSRECAICGRTDSGITAEKNTCRVCSAFTRLSARMAEPDTLFAVSETPQSEEDALPLFSAEGTPLFLFPVRENAAGESAAKRLFAKQASLRADVIPLHMGDLLARNEEGFAATLEELSATTGLDRIAVLRADVDGLGHAFTRGFEHPGEQQPFRDVSLLRTISFSHAMTLFFKRYINAVLEDRQFVLPGFGREENRLTVVYSGGDDLFLIGPWDQLLCAAVDLREAFGRYTGGALTLSAGLGLFDGKYPVSSMARETGRLEDCAKGCSAGGKDKDAVALFGVVPVGGNLLCPDTYHWDTLKGRVLGEKYELITELAGAGGVRDPAMKGNSFLYKLLECLRGSSDRMNLARLAYLLARQDADTVAPENVKKLYGWALKEQDRRELITAIMINVYSGRREG